MFGAQDLNAPAEDRSCAGEAEQPTRLSADIDAQIFAQCSALENYAQLVNRDCNQRKQTVGLISTHVAKAARLACDFAFVRFLMTGEFECTGLLSALQAKKDVRNVEELQRYYLQLAECTENALEELPVSNEVEFRKADVDNVVKCICDLENQMQVPNDATETDSTVDFNFAVPMCESTAKHSISLYHWIKDHTNQSDGTDEEISALSENSHALSYRLAVIKHLQEKITSLRNINNLQINWELIPASSIQSSPFLTDLKEQCYSLHNLISVAKSNENPITQSVQLFNNIKKEFLEFQKTTYSEMVNLESKIAKNSASIKEKQQEVANAKRELDSYREKLKANARITKLSTDDIDAKISELQLSLPSNDAFSRISRACSSNARAVSAIERALAEITTTVTADLQIRERTRAARSEIDLLRSLNARADACLLRLPVLTAPAAPGDPQPRRSRAAALDRSISAAEESIARLSSTAASRRAAYHSLGARSSLLRHRRMALCPLCRSRHRNALLTVCGHALCQRCLRAHTAPACPICGRQYAARDVAPFVLSPRDR